MIPAAVVTVTAAVVLVGTAAAPRGAESGLDLVIASERDATVGKCLILDSLAWSCSWEALLEMRDVCQAKTSEEREDQSALREIMRTEMLPERLACCLRHRTSCLGSTEGSSALRQQYP